jgi:hypothetical protein
VRFEGWRKVTSAHAPVRQLVPEEAFKFETIRRAARPQVMGSVQL